MRKPFLYLYSIPTTIFQAIYDASLAYLLVFHLLPVGLPLHPPAFSTGLFLALYSSVALDRDLMEKAMGKALEWAESVEPQSTHLSVPALCPHAQHISLFSLGEVWKVFDIWIKQMGNITTTPLLAPLAFHTLLLVV
jgi:hypothetical protein